MSFIHALLLILSLSVLSSCISLERKNIVRLSKAEGLLKTNEQEAMRIYQEIPDTVCKNLGFYHYHDNLCLANMHYYKALNSIGKGNIEEAYLQVCNLMETNTLINHQTKDGRLLLEKELQVLKQLDSYRLAFKDSTSEANDSIINVLTNAVRNLYPQALQHNVEDQTAQTEHFYFHHKYYLPLVILLLLVVGFLIYQQHKSEEYETSQQTNQSQQNMLNEKIAKLKSDIKKNEEEIVRLSTLSTNLKNQTKQSLGIGKTIFENVKNGGDMKNISIENEQHFIDYYAFAFPEEFDTIVKPFKTLSLRHTTYLILQQMGFSDNEIQRILFVKGSTIRNYRLRINRNKKH